MKTATIFVFLILVMSCAPRQGSDDQTIQKEVNKIPVYVKQMKPERFQHFIQVNGSVEAEKDAVISPEINGQIKTIHVQEGDRVSKGQLLVSLNTSVTESTIAELKTGLDLAIKLFEKQNELWSQNIGSEIQYLEAKNAKESAETRLKTLQAQLEMARIKAPFDGIVEELYSKVGELASPGIGLLHVINLSALRIEAAVSETYIANLKEGDTVELEFPSFPEMHIVVPIHRIGNVIQPQSRTFTIELRLVNPGEVIKPNMLTRVKINDFSDDNALIVPAFILKQDKTGSYLYVAQKNSELLTATKRYVKEGPTYENKTMILSGLNPGDRVIIEGYNQVNNGIPIEIK